MISKELKIATSVSVLFAVLYIYYEIPWGLMDDYKWIVRTEEFLANPFSSYLEFQKYMISKGTLQPFIHLQYLIQYVPGIYTTPLFTHIENIFILIFIHFFLYKVFGQKLRINYLFSLAIFLIFPYTYDLFLLPSLQEKFSIPLFSYLIYKLEKNRDSSTNSTLDIFLISFSIPLIKLQGSVFILFVFFYYLLHKTKSSQFSILGFAFSISLQAYLLFFTNSGYYVLEKTVNQVINNLLSIQNLLFISIVFIGFFFAFFEKNRETKLYIFGLGLSSLATIFILINWDSYGYLYSFYAFFLCLIVPFIIRFFLEAIKIPILNNFVSLVLIGLTLMSVSLFFVPRAERWSDLNYVYSVLDTNKLDHEIYYCGSEGVLTFNNLNQSKNEIQFAGNFSEIKVNDFYLISDDLQCNYLEDELLSTCKTSTPFMSKYNRMEIKKYSCNS